MIKTRKLLSAVVALAFTAGMVACEGEKGRAGADGVDGNPDVKSYTFEVINNEWDNRMDPTCTYDYALSAITDDVVNGGAVVGFVRSIDNINLDKFVSQEWTALPYSKAGFVFVGGNAVTVLLGYGYEKGEINLRLSASAGIALPEIIPNSTTPVPGDLEFKFIVIPSSALVAGVPADASYEELTKVYNFENIEL